jgi:membrane dipeptidase
VLSSADGRLFDHGGLDSMEKGGVALQGFAAWVPSEYPDKLSLTLKQIAFLKDMINSSNGRIILCRALEDLFVPGPIKAVLAIESCDCIDCDADAIARVYGLGARILSLTWNDENSFASGCLSEGGLKEDGLKAIKELNRLRIAFDVSHLNEQSFWEAINQYEYAPCATHSCAYTVYPTPRNLKDDQIKSIIERGGYIGTNFYTEFLKGRTATIEDILRHIEYILELGGQDCVGLGSDFCGIQYTPDGLDSVADFQSVPESMYKRNYTSDMISKICYGNFEKYILKFL